MKYLLQVCLAAGLMFNGSLSVAAQSNEARTAAQSMRPSDSVPVLREGISVDLPITTNAAAVPGADKEDAAVVTLTRNGNLYLGTTEVSSADLIENVNRALSASAGKTVYIKADARVPYANVVGVLDRLRAAGIEDVTLLTTQREPGETSNRVTPKGFEMRVVGKSARLY